LWHRKLVEVKDGESLEGSPVWGCRFRRRRGLDSPLGRLVRDKEEEEPAQATDGLVQLLAASRVTAAQVKLGERSRAEASLGRELFVATAAGHARVVEKCLRRRADPWQRDSAGNVPLHLANEEVAHLLLDACPAASGVRNWQGQSAASHLISLGWQVAERIPLEVLLKLEIQDIEEEPEGSKSSDPERERYVMLSCDVNGKLLEYVDMVKKCLEEKGIQTMLKSEGETSGAMFRKDNLKAMVVFGTKDYGEKGRQTYYDLKHAYRHNIDLIPLQLSETWPPEPLCSGEHPLRDTATRIRDEKMEKPMEKAVEIAKALRHLAKDPAKKDLPTRKKVLRRSFTLSLLPSPDELSEAMEDIFRLSLLCKQLTPGLEAMILFHLTREAGMDVKEKLQGMICQLFQKHGEELKVGLAGPWEQLAKWLLEVLTRCALRPSQSTLPGSFAMWLADNVEKLQKVLPQTRFFASLENSDPTNLTTPEKNHLSWLLMGVRRLDRMAKRNDLVPKGETQDSLDLGFRVETEEDLRRAAVEMHLQCIVPSVAEELVLALQAVRRCVKDVTNLQGCAAWLHCAQLWHRSCQAERDVQRRVVQLLEKSQVPFSLTHPAIPSLETLWQKALSLWPRMLKMDLPGVHLCEVLVWELEMASAALLRDMHSFLSSLMFCRDGAELMWTSAAPMDGFCDAAGLQEGLLLKTNAGPVFMQLRLFLSPGIDHKLLEFFNSMAMGHFLPSPFQPFWVTWLRLELALRKAEKAKNSRTLKAALHQAYQELGNEKFKVFVGTFWLARLEALSKLLLRLEEEERMAEDDMEIALQDRAAMAQQYLNQVASTWDRLDPCIPEPEMPLPLETWPEVQEERPAAGSPTLEFYLSNVSLAAPESRTKISALAENRLQFWQHKVSSGTD